ncbi:MAG: hypothetical protein M1812_000494 [Candelaria pacifica]|nr:MAG: hypothetical protein M1812_000494 [Candelaria pacifica]
MRDYPDSRQRPTSSTHNSSDLPIDLYGFHNSQIGNQNSAYTSPLSGSNPTLSTAKSLPDILRIGSPVIERGGNPYNNFDNTQPSLGRPQSAFQATRPTQPATRRLSQPAEFGTTLPTAYEIPQAPAPPILPTAAALNTDFDYGRRPSTRVGEGLSRSTSRVGSANKKILDRFKSFRSPNLSRPTSLLRRGEYGRIDEQDESFQKHLGTVTDADDAVISDPLGYDISSFDGPLGASNGPIGLQNLPRPLTPHATKDRELRQAGLAAEYHQLEAGGILTGGLGGGLAPAKVAVNVPNGAHLVARNYSVRETGQRAAKERGEIVAIAEGVDLSSFGNEGSGLGIQTDHDPGSAKPLTKTTDQSYYFPPDPEMPNWRPVSMGWPYITGLVVVAIALAAGTEYLFRVSTKPGGLIKFKRPQEVSVWDYFCWKYLPTIVAVSYGILWQIVDFEVKRLEPYYQLSKPTGALAAESLNLDYLTFWAYLTPFKAMRYRQWAVVSSSVASVLASSVVPTLQSASMNLTPEPEKRRDNEFKYVRMDHVWSRLLTTSLVVIAALGILLLFQLRRKSGLLGDPKGIAGVAAMANKSHILMDFKGLDTKKHDAIHERLKHRRYILHKSSLWQGEYIKHSTEAIDARKVENPHPLMLRLRAGVPFIAFLLAFIAFIPSLMFTKMNVVAQKLPWLPTAIATIVQLIWSTLDCDVRMIEPFYILSLRGALSKTLTLDYSGDPWGYMPLKAIKNGHFLVALVGFGSVLTQVLTVCVSSFGVKGSEFFPKDHNGTLPDDTKDVNQADNRYNGQETFKSFWVSFALALSILLILCISAALVYFLRRHPFLPRQPGTIASVLAFIHQSKMLYDFVDTEKYTDVTQMTRHLERVGKSYGLGWFRGRDGEIHCGVDEEPLLARYTHGKDYSDVVDPWAGNWAQY